MTSPKSRQQLTQEVLKDLNDIEFKRKTNRWAFKAPNASPEYLYPLFVMGLLSTPLWYFLFNIHPLIIASLLIVAFIIAGITFRKRNNLGANLNQVIRATILKRIEPDWTYTNESRISIEALSRSTLFDLKGLIISGQDHLKGNYKEKYFECSQLEIGDSDEIKSTWLFISINAIYPIQELLLLCSALVKNRYTVLGLSKPKWAFFPDHFPIITPNNIVLDYPERSTFDTNFSLFGHDPNTAQVVLSSKRIAGLEQFKKRISDTFRIAFTDRQIFFAMKYDGLPNLNPRFPLEPNGIFRQFNNHLKLIRHIIDSLCEE